MVKYYPEPAPFALTEREQEFVDYITRELNRVSQTLLTQADISLEEKFVAPSKPQLGQITYADGTRWDPGAGAGFYGYDGTTWWILGGAGAAITGYVHITGDTMTGDLEVNKSSAADTGFVLVNTAGAGALDVSAAGNTKIIFDATKLFAFQTDSKSNIDAHTYSATSVWTLTGSTGAIVQTGSLTLPASASGQEALIIPHGAAPTTPTNGSIWTTTAGAFARLSGANYTFDFINLAQTYTARKVHSAGVTGNGGMATATGSLGEVEVDGNGTGAAMMTFHRPGAFAAYFGIDTDSKWKVGGWSMGANAYEIVHLGNYTSLLTFQKAYESAQQTITSAGALTLGHGLGVKPKFVLPVLQCTTAEGNYSVGDEVFISFSADDRTNNRGLSVVPDATNLNVRFGSDTTCFNLLNKSTGARFAATNGNWKLVMRAWA